jgi:hypothetical protein
MGEAAGSASSGDGVWLMCYFLHRYLDFRVPEVESLAELAGAGEQIAWCGAPCSAWQPGGCARSTRSAAPREPARRAPRG